MNGLLVRVGIDQTAGSWNSPVDSKTGEFIYVPIPEEDYGLRRGLMPRNNRLIPRLARFGAALPRHLRGQPMQLDPGFGTLTYGGCTGRATQTRRLGLGDLLIFYAGLTHTGGRVKWAGESSVMPQSPGQMSRDNPPTVGSVYVASP